MRDERVESLPNVAIERSLTEYELDPEAKQALGRVSPELAWLQVKTLVQEAIQQEYDQAEEMRLQANYPVDLTDLTEVLEVMNPVRGVNQVHYANESLNLQHLPQQPPLKVLQALLNMLMNSDRYNSLLP
jgi:hypothetical protein